MSRGNITIREMENRFAQSCKELDKAKKELENMTKEMKLMLKKIRIWKNDDTVYRYLLKPHTCLMAFQLYQEVVVEVEDQMHEGIDIFLEVGNWNPTSRNYDLFKKYVK
ncbi:hypothetical protein ACFE04_001403 [Oxalis oulophora]